MDNNNYQNNGNQYNPYSNPYGQPYNGQPFNQAPAEPPKRKSLGSAIASMVCGIFGLIYGLVMFIVSVATSVAAYELTRNRPFGIQGMYHYHETSFAAGIIVIISFAIFTLPLGIVSVALGGSYKKKNNGHCGMSKAGVITGWFTLGFFILSVIAIFALNS